MSSTSSTSSALAPLADPPTRLVDGAAMDYFMIECVEVLRNSARVATARAKKIEDEMIDAGLIPPPPPPAAHLKKGNLRDSVASSSGADKTLLDEEEEDLRVRLEAIGLHVGMNVTERLCHDRPLFSDTLDTIKFICKDLWATCWDKQVDNLRTNHRGVYVLQDNAFRPVAHISSWESRADATRRAKLYVSLPVGIIRGSLLRLGLQGTVIPEINLPQCTFQVKLPKGS
ncbi:transport protein particle component [Vararia minispora EC-137]|uniref:Transport protein particle component n=1 Tax=Vararia minispora EC-137 TaxID=1314806 RepID=A0ACB8QPC7_9AGAM|nr:transport protein particle component [Vararia minispora EC-137]